MRKIVFQNLSITIISKLIAFVLFLYVAKILSTTDYGIFVYIGMLVSLLPLFQLGSMHGTSILLPKYIVSKEKNEKDLFYTYTCISHLLQVLSVGILFFFDIELNLKVLIVIAFNFVLTKYIEGAQMFLNANLKFEKSNIIKSVDQILKPLITLFFFVYYSTIESIFIAQLVATIISFSVSICYVKFELKRIDFYEEIITLKAIYKLGFFIYITWAIDILFRTADRWFISQYYSIEDLATYGFTSSLAMNLWLLSMSFFSPFTQVLYKYVAENNFIEVKKVIEATNRKLYILLGAVSLVAVFSYPFLLEFVVQKYFETHLLFVVLILVSIFLSINNMYIYYMISNNLHFVLLKYQSIILIINLTLNCLFTYLHLDIIYFGYSTILSLIIYYILVRRHFYLAVEQKIIETS